MKTYLINQNTKTIENVLLGKTMFFGLEDFVNRIVKGNCCFICGFPPDSKQFTNEHVIPDWILRRFKLHDSQLILPNGTFIKYGHYTVPCCQECNSELGKKVEAPISNLLRNSYPKLVEEIKKDKSLFKELFRWMCLIYLKTHLKDTLLLLNRDRREDMGKIGDYYDWGDLHHIHCMARLHYTNAIVDEKVYGSILVLPVLRMAGEQFDYMDNLEAKTVLIQVGELCIIAILNDSQAFLSAFSDHLEKVTGPLTVFQLKDIFSHMVYMNVNLKEKPKYHSTITQNGYEIQATVSESIELYSGEDEKINRGEILHFYVSKIIQEDLLNREEILQSIKEGKRQYLFDENGKFIQHKNK